MICVISGKARAGKNILGEYLAKELFNKSKKTYVLMAYAHHLKCKVQKEFDLSWEQLWGNEKEVEDVRYPKENGGCWAAREILQKVGTDCYRSIDPNFWVKALFNTIDEKEYKNVIITDGRFRSEIEPVKKRNGLHIRVNRGTENKIHGKEHSSETSLDDCKPDFNVDNNGTLEDLRKTASEIVDAILQIEKIGGF